MGEGVFEGVCVGVGVRGGVCVCAQKEFLTGCFFMVS